MGHKALWITGVYLKPMPNDLLEGNDKMLGHAKSSQFCHQFQPDYYMTETDLGIQTNVLMVK